MLTVVVALWHAHSMEGLMLLAVVIGQAVMGVLGSQWARRIERIAMDLQDKLAAAVEALTGVRDRLDEALPELVGKIGDLESEVAALKEQVGAAADFSALDSVVAEVKSRADALADVVPNAVEPEPEPEPGPEVADENPVADTAADDPEPDTGQE